MTNEDATDLPYGQFGRTFYDTETQEWSFARNLSRTSASRTISGFKRKPIAVSGNNNGTNIVDDELHLQDSRRFRQEFDELCLRFPDLRPADAILEEIRSFSLAGQDRTESLERRDLIALSTTRSAARHRQVSIAAFTSGVDGFALKLVPLTTRKYTWQDAQHESIIAPSISTSGMVWRSDEGPIRQISFGEQIDRNKRSQQPLLLVLLHSKVVVFQVVSPFRSRHQNNDIGMMVLAKIESDTLHGSPACHAIANPYVSGVIAAINNVGDWSLYHVQRYGAYRIAVKYSSATDASSTSSELHHDGWRRLSWLNDGTVLATASRNEVLFYHVMPRCTPNKVAVFSPGAASSSTSWIFDMVEIKLGSSMCAVLTSTHIVLVELLERSRSSFRLAELMRIRHYRNPADATLRLYTWNDGQDAILNLSSITSSSITSYRIHVDSRGRPVCSDISQVNLASGLDVARQEQLVDYAILPKDLKLRAPQRPDDEFDLEGNDGSFAIYFMAFGSDYNMSIAERLIHQSSRGDILKHSLIAEVENHQPASDALVQEDPFVASDGEELEYDEMPTLSRGEPIGRMTRTKRTRLGPSIKQEVWQDLMRRLAELQSESLDVVVERVRRERDSRTPRLLSEMSMAEVRIDSSEEVAQKINDMLNKQTPQEGTDNMSDDEQDNPSELSIRPIPATSSSVLNLAGPMSNLEALQSQINAKWITPLHSSVTGRVRIAKENLSRRIAADILLASHTIGTAEMEVANPAQSPDEVPPTPVQMYNLPLRSLPSRSYRLSGIAEHDSESNDLNSSPLPHTTLPTPSPTATPSITTFSSRTSTLAPHIERLSKYTTINPQPNTSRSNLLTTKPNRLTTRVLTHWTLGADPSTYDYQSTATRIRQRTEAEESAADMTEQERRRAQRAAERHIRRQRKEAAASEAARLASSQVPIVRRYDAGVGSSSQPVRTGRKRMGSVGLEGGSDGVVGRGGVGSSQSYYAGGDRGLPATQTLPGRYGGRMPVKKKKKRKSGF